MRAQRRRLRPEEKKCADTDTVATPCRAQVQGLVRDYSLVDVAWHLVFFLVLPWTCMVCARARVR